MPRGNFEAMCTPIPNHKITVNSRGEGGCLEKRPRKPSWDTLFPVNLGFYWKHSRDAKNHFRILQYLGCMGTPPSCCTKHVLSLL